MENKVQRKKIKEFTNSLTLGGQQITRTISKRIDSLINSCLESKTAAKDICNKIDACPQPYTAEEALARVIDSKMSVETYQSLRMNMVECKCPLFPPYYKVKTAKLACYPEGVVVSERDAHVGMQSLLQHTFDRIVSLNDEVFKQYCETQNIQELEVILEGSWGFDGTTGQSLYKQVFCDGDCDERSLFATTFTPLRIIVKREGSPIVLWMNSTPQSYRYCRPISINY